MSCQAFSSVRPLMWDVRISEDDIQFTSPMMNIDRSLRALPQLHIQRKLFISSSWDWRSQCNDCKIMMDCSGSDHIYIKTMSNLKKKINRYWTSNLIKIKLMVIPKLWNLFILYKDSDQIIKYQFRLWQLLETSLLEVINQVTQHHEVIFGWILFS